MDFSITKMLQDSKVAGLRQVVRGINSQQIRCVLLADDADLHIKEQIKTLCTRHNIPIIPCESKHDLGKKLGIDRSCSTVGFLR